MELWKIVDPRVAILVASKEKIVFYFWVNARADWWIAKTSICAYQWPLLHCYNECWLHIDNNISSPALVRLLGYISAYHWTLFPLHSTFLFAVSWELLKRHFVDARPRLQFFPNSCLLQMQIIFFQLSLMICIFNITSNMSISLNSLGYINNKMSYLFCIKIAILIIHSQKSHCHKSSYFRAKNFNFLQTFGRFQ
jgi:hypothetical protein